MSSQGSAASEMESLPWVCRLVSAFRSEPPAAIHSKLTQQSAAPAMIHTLAISGYRSLRDLALPLDRLTLVTGANGTGKSSLYRALRLLADASLNSVVASLAREGGLPSTL